MEYNIANLFLLKKDKAGFKRIIRCLSSSKTKTSEISLAKSISSVITHILIEMEGAESKEDSMKRANGYRLFDWMEILTGLVSGAFTVEESLAEIKKMLEDPS